MKKLLIIISISLLTVGVAVAVVYSSKEKMIASSLEKGLSKVTGLEVKVGNIEVLENGKLVKIDRITLLNPVGFETARLASILNVEMQCDPKKFIFRKGLYCSHVSATLDELMFERLQDGKLNVREITSLQRSFLEEPIIAGNQAGFMIERLELKIGKILVSEYAGNAKRTSEVPLVGRREVYGYVTDPHTLIHLPILKALNALNRGSMGIPRNEIQKRVAETTGVK